MNSPWSQDKYRLALNFAAHAHHGQTMPGSKHPYLVHLVLVAMEVQAALQVEAGWDGDLAIQCALLHDTLEDTQTTLQQVQEVFGLAVAEGVLALTKREDLPKEQAMADSLQRIQMQPKEIWLVKLADRIVNLSSTRPCWSPEKNRFYRDEGWLIYQALAPATPYLAERLQQKIEQFLA
ncbi:MAG: bifunctional (p)ppGpp synthetase/guanosine-3',5'-bis(diphosphate) 3'-pyrophosphohydrolase [Magnetococcales bacterium]|nr:bifunctional (p)ppGpp synthetase/guanosine-3',5'-bis(diphosphate) 3'-pyrophosphohydrolase [Magnetococcales bacterium]